MFGQATAHRRANAFAQALERQAAESQAAEGQSADGQVPESRPLGNAPVPGDTTGEHGGRHEHGAHAAPRHADPEQAAMLALAASLSNRPRPVLDAEKKTMQRAQLIAAMEQALADGSFEAGGRVPEQRAEGRGGNRAAGLRTFGPRSRLSRRLAVGGLTVGVAAGAFGGVAAASTDALPGDTLYGLKRSMEDLRLDLAGSDASRGKVYLDLASTRMQEARRLMDRGRGGTLDDESVGEVRKALSGMHQEASEGHRLLSQAYQEDGSLHSMALLNSFAQAHRQSWSDLRGKLPSQLTDVSDQVSSVFDAISNEIAPLESLLPAPKDSGSPATHGSDRTGSGDSGSQSHGTGTASPSAPTAPRGQASPPSGTASPSPSGTTGGLIGGSGDLLSPPTAGSPTTSGTSPTNPTTSPSHSVILPPLLPGLLPDLGFTEPDGEP
ncbi:DUF5667 domain-containing protein [Streptomyces sp.]|uniref:DUF5667 domain-containing protein n=1 Tax=Streptomyces sp. TaxID=1931 RepID=UPI002F3F8BD3